MKSGKPRQKLGRPRKFDPDQALDQAMQLFWHKGYDATSLNDLTETLGVNRPSLYAAFGNKDELFVRALEHYWASPANYIKQALNQRTIRQVVMHLLLGVVDRGTRPGNPPGCLFVSGALSCSGADPRLHHELRAAWKNGQARITQRLQHAVETGELPPKTDVTVLMRMIVTTSFGLSVQASLGAKRAELLAVIDACLARWGLEKNRPGAHGRQSGKRVRTSSVLRAPKT